MPINGGGVVAGGAVPTIIGFCNADAKPPGPVQLKVSPGEAGVTVNTSVSICPAHNGELFETVNIGLGWIMTCVLSVSCTPAKVFIT